jgi:hypothetical protein
MSVLLGQATTPSSSQGSYEIALLNLLVYSKRQHYHHRRRRILLLADQIDRWSFTL